MSNRKEKKLARTSDEDKAEKSSMSNENESLNNSDSNDSLPQSQAPEPSRLRVSTTINDSPSTSNGERSTEREVTPYDRSIILGLSSPPIEKSENNAIIPTATGITITAHNYQSRLRAAALAYARQQQNEQQVMNNRLQIRHREQRSKSRRQRNQGLCPCFSPIHSDSDDEAQTAEITNSGGIMNRWMNNLRYRIAVTGEPSATSIVSYRRCGQGVSLQAPPYPVHSTIAYTHYLVPKLDEIAKSPYYWGKMNRFEAEKLLDGTSEGTFLLRDSAQIDYVFSVSFRRYNRTLHARIEQSEHRFSFDSFDQNIFSAPTVTELIGHYKDREKCMFFEPQLTNPLARNFPFDLQHLCRATICTNLKEYGAIDQLPLPLRQLGDYLKEYHYKQQVAINNAEVENASK